MLTQYILRIATYFTVRSFVQTNTGNYHVGFPKMLITPQRILYYRKRS